MSGYISVNKPKIPSKALKYVSNCLKNGWISSEGKFVDKFEKEFAKYLGIKYATTTNSGTSALHLALASLGIGPGDEVIVPALTIASCYFAIWYTGAKAVPADADPITFNLDPRKIEELITQNTKAIMAVHLFGYPCDMSRIIKIARKYKLKVIEDSAEAHGAEYLGKKVGSIGDIGCFSFYANKIVTTGEGGMLVTNNHQIYDKAKKIKSLNHTPRKRFVHAGIGYKYLMTNVQAAIGLASLEEIEASIKYKHKIARTYSKRLGKISGLTLPVQEKDVLSVYWMYAILVNQKRFGISRNKLMWILADKYHIQTRTFFFPPNIAFRRLGVYANQSFPIAEKLSREGLYLPSGLGTTMGSIQKTCDAIVEIKRLIDKAG